MDTIHKEASPTPLLILEQASIKAGCLQNQSKNLIIVWLKDPRFLQHLPELIPYFRNGNER